MPEYKMSMQKNTMQKEPAPLQKKRHNEKDAVQVEKQVPNSLKKQIEMEQLKEKRKYQSIEDIVSESKQTKKIIYKFLKKGFNALSAEELAATLEKVNPRFAADFFENTQEDWN